MAGTDVWLWWIAGAVAMALSGALLVRCRCLVDGTLAAVLALDGFSSLFRGARLLNPTAASWVPPLVLASLGALAAYLAAHYADRTGQRTPLAWVAVPASLGIAAAVSVVAAPNLWISSAGRVGPLFAVGTLLPLLFAIAAWLMVLDYSREPDASARRRLSWLALGFALVPSFGAAIELQVVGFNPPVGGWFAAAHWAILAAFPVAIAAFATMARAGANLDEQAKSTTARFLLVFILPWLSVGAVAAMGAAGANGAALGNSMEAAWRLAAAGAVALAILRSSGGPSARMGRSKSQKPAWGTLHERKIAFVAHLPESGKLSAAAIESIRLSLRLPPAVAQELLDAHGATNSKSS